MQNKTNADMDSLKINENKKLNKYLDVGEVVILSSTVTKINHVNKRQERALAVTNKNIINIASPKSILPNRIKRKMPLHKVLGITSSRYGNQIVIHLQGEDDYRFFTANLKNKYIECMIVAYGKATHKQVKLYWYDDLALDQYTTTIIDLDNKRRKEHKTEPVLVDETYLQKNVLTKPQSKLIFKGTNTENVVNFQQFDIIKVLGRGAYGKVMLCKHEKTKSYYAVKSMRKQDLIEKQSLQRTKTERLLLEKVSHPFLVNLEFAFTTKQKIFLIMKFYRGGEMFSKIRRDKKFPEKRVKFYAAQVFLAIEYLHQMGFVYRDLKPENILFDMNGYIKVSDYGLAKELKKGEKTYSLTGTASYLSPEVIMNEGHSFTVDWWSLGVLIYQMIYSAPPFYCKDQREMFARIVNKEVYFPTDNNVSAECKDLLRGLLNKYPHKRLGHEGSQAIKQHPWFQDMDWNALLQMKIKPDYVPSAVSDDDVSNFLEVFTSEEPVDTIINCDTTLLNKFQKEFQGFNFQRLQTLSESNKKYEINPQFSPTLGSHLKQSSSNSVTLFSKKKP